MEGLLSYLLCVAEELASWIKTGEHSRLVLLGRDTHLLMGLLHELHGVHAQYFHWSRLSPALRTHRQWLKEVSPGATVIDSGYGGSIMDLLRRDPHVRACRLVSTEGTYPPVLADGESLAVFELVKLWEDLPKHHHRVAEYERDHAIPVTEEPEPDSGVVDYDLAVGTARDLLREAGLSPAAADRWARFTGLTPEERLGPDYLRHMAQVAELRKQLANAPKPLQVLEAVEKDDPSFSDDYLAWYGEMFAAGLNRHLPVETRGARTSQELEWRLLFGDRVPRHARAQYRGLLLLRWAMQLPAVDPTLGPKSWA